MSNPQQDINLALKLLQRIAEALEKIATELDYWPKA